VAILSGEDLRAFMSDPEWTDAQLREADRLMARVESTLASALGSPIDPVPWTETARVLESGLVATRYPVASVQRLGDVEVADGAALPAPYVLQGHWVRVPDGQSAALSPLGGSYPLVSSSSTDMFAGLGGYGEVGMAGRVRGYGSVFIAYMAGWGALGALELGLLRKGEAIFGNRNADSVATNRNLDVDKPPAKAKETWTDEEIENELGIFRNVHVLK
jgi:hypothetical protein